MGKFDLDGDGEISDLEFEAYKLIRDKDKSSETDETVQSAEMSNDEKHLFKPSEFVDDATNDWLMDELG